MHAPPRMNTHGFTMKQFIEEFSCSGCARTGHATWQGEAQKPRRLSEMGGGFSLRPDDDNPIVQSIVCDYCGTRQPAQMSPENTRH